MTNGFKIVAFLLEAEFQPDLPFNPEIQNTYAPQEPVLDPDEVDVKDFVDDMLDDQSKERRIATSYHEYWWPEGQEDYEEENGWEDEEGEDLTLDEWDIENGETNVTKAISFLYSNGVYANEGDTDSYEAADAVVDYHTGHEKKLSYHLRGYTPEELKAINFGLIQKRKQRYALPN